MAQSRTHRSPRRMWSSSWSSRHLSASGSECVSGSSTTGRSTPVTNGDETAAEVRTATGQCRPSRVQQCRSVSKTVSSVTGREVCTRRPRALRVRSFRTSSHAAPSSQMPAARARTHLGRTSVPPDAVAPVSSGTTGSTGAAAVPGRADSVSTAAGVSPAAAGSEVRSPRTREKSRPRGTSANTRLSRTGRSTAPGTTTAAAGTPPLPRCRRWPGSPAYQSACSASCSNQRRRVSSSSFFRGSPP